MKIVFVITRLNRTINEGKHLICGVNASSLPYNEISENLFWPVKSDTSLANRPVSLKVSLQPWLHIVWPLNNSTAEIIGQYYGKTGVKIALRPTLGKYRLVSQLHIHIEF